MDNACGLALGSYLSQWCGTFYLDGLDHFVKRELKIRAYLRYMDDFVLFSNDRSQLVNARAVIAAWLAEERSFGYIPNAGMSCPTRIRVFFWATGSVAPELRPAATTPCHATALTHRSEQRTRGTGAEHTIVPWVVVILTRQMTNDTCVTTMTIVTCGALALRASKTRQGANGTKTKAGGAGGAHSESRWSYRRPGSSQTRFADRRFRGSSSPAEPPRRTRRSPFSGPIGSMTASARYVLYRSQHHSQTLPLISWSPQGFGAFSPTGCTLLLALAANQA